MDGLCKIVDFWIRVVSVFSVLCQHFRASTTQNDLRATLAPRVLSSLNSAPPVSLLREIEVSGSDGAAGEFFSFWNVFSLISL